MHKEEKLKEVYKMKKEIKKRLTILMWELDIDNDELYYQTGYHKEDVKTKEDLNEVVRLFSNWYFGLEKFYMK